LDAQWKKIDEYWEKGRSITEGLIQ